ncbi:STAGA complex 65 subunit gamma-like [Diadema antillarum]|uniref:STAGA complex 65 subunit gamma-like n=1 Tax=Diadema antillarum TaxID=105358 RepID=UPI003A83D4F8
MSRGYWGEMPSSMAAAGTASAGVDIDAMATKSPSIQVTAPHLHQPSAQQKPQVLLLQPELCRPDRTSLHTIDLLKHCRQIRGKMSTFQNQHESTKSDDGFSRPRLPPLPAQPQIVKDEKMASSIPVITGIRQRPGCPRLQLRDGNVEIDSSVARQLTRRAAATICAHSGYDTSQESSLETLTDVLQEFLANTCKLLRVAVDREAHTGQTGFQDPLTQVFYEIGVGSRETLFNFWKTRIRDYHDRVTKRTEELREKYEEMQNPNYQMHAHDEKSPRVKEESLSDASFYDPQSHSQDEVLENQSESSSSEVPSNQPLSFHSLGNMELDDATAAVPGSAIGGGGESVEVAEEEEGGNWYGVKEEDAGEAVGSTGIKREVISGDESSQDVKAEETIIQGSPSLGGQVPSHNLNTDSTSPTDKKIQLQMPPRKKKKK